MSKSSDNFQSHGIYNRLITFVVDHFIFQSQKKVILGRPEAMPVHESIEVPIIGSSRNVKIMPSNTSIGGINGVLNNEVVIDFRNIEEEEEVAEISTSTSSPVEQGKDRGGRGRGRGRGRLQNSADLSRKERSEDHIREKYTAEPATISGNESDDAIRKHISRSRGSRPHQKSVAVASNINEKADAFIRSRKEAMKKNFGDVS